MTDTHTHLYLEEFDSDGGPAAVERALAAGVEMMILPNVDESTVERMMELHHRFSGSTRIAMGLHPTEVKEDWEEVLGRLRPMMEVDGCVAIGEVGMDLYWDRTYRDEQMEVFRAQLQEARERNLSVIIHCREALDETLECIAAEEMGRHPLVFHSFTGTTDDVHRILEVAPAAMFGINGVVTFKNAAELREALPEIGIDRILTETDSPYLAPVPHRGRRNESAYIPEVVRKIAEVLELTFEEVERATDANARRFFRIG